MNSFFCDICIPEKQDFDGKNYHIVSQYKDRHWYQNKQYYEDSQSYVYPYHEGGPSFYPEFFKNYPGQRFPGRTRFHHRGGFYPRRRGFFAPRWPRNSRGSYHNFQTQGFPNVPSHYYDNVRNDYYRYFQKLAKGKKRNRSNSSHSSDSTHSYKHSRSRSRSSKRTKSHSKSWSHSHSPSNSSWSEMCSRSRSRSWSRKKSHSRSCSRTRSRSASKSDKCSKKSESVEKGGMKQETVNVLENIKSNHSHAKRKKKKHKKDKNSDKHKGKVKHKKKCD